MASRVSCHRVHLARGTFQVHLKIGMNAVGWERSSHSYCCDINWSNEKGLIGAHGLREYSPLQGKPVFRAVTPVVARLGSSEIAD